MRTSSLNNPNPVLASHGVSTDERLARLNALDFTNVKHKLMEAEPEGKGWTPEQCDEAEKWYKRFLALGVCYPHESIVPNLPIDLFWHQHILDTRAYSADCDSIFGEFLHHFPYFGMRGAEDAANRDDAFDRTNELYRHHFGDDCCSMHTFSKAAIPEDCMVSLKGNDGSVGAAGCTAPCTTSACQGGGTCSPCTVDRRETLNDPLSIMLGGPTTIPAMNCRGGGGQKCGRSCGRGK